MFMVGAMLAMVVEGTLLLLMSSGTYVDSIVDRVIIYAICIGVVTPLYSQQAREAAAAKKRDVVPGPSTPETGVPVLLPDNVTVYYHPAGLWQRLLAALTDGALIAFVSGAYLTLVTAVQATSGARGPLGPLSAAGEVGLLLIPLIYFLATEVYADGQTPGKMLYRLRAIHETGRSLSVSEIYVRNLLRVLPLMVVFIPIELSCLRSGAWRQRLGDIAAGAVVIQEA
jgi:uncharacterized RDD family membrane protein YckC